MTAPRRTTAFVASALATRALRDSWLLAALERDGLLTAQAADQLRRQAPEWVASAVIEKQLVSANLVIQTAARAAHD